MSMSGTDRKQTYARCRNRDCSRPGRLTAQLWLGQLTFLEHGRLPFFTVRSHAGGCSMVAGCYSMPLHAPIGEMAKQRKARDQED